MNECTTPVCKNGAACRDKPGTYECLCTPNWTGFDCSIPASNSTVENPNSSSLLPPTSSLTDYENDSIPASLHTSLIIRCTVIGSAVVLFTLLLIASLYLILRRRKFWQHKKSGFVELQRPSLQPPTSVQHTRPGTVYWNTPSLAEPMLLCAPGDATIRHKTLFGTQKAPLNGKEGLCLEKSLIYDSPLSPPSMIFSVSGGPSMHHRAIVYAYQSPPPPYEESEGRKRSPSQS